MAKYDVRIEADEARLQAQLGREAYIELMAAAEESLLRELEHIGEELKAELTAALSLHSTRASVPSACSTIERHCETTLHMGVWTDMVSTSTGCSHSRQMQHAELAPAEWMVIERRCTLALYSE